MIADGQYQIAPARARIMLDEFLAASLSADPDTEVQKVARYVVLGRGHRWRGLIAIAAGRIFDPDALRICLACGAAFEIVHAASLLLDDLPSMDNARIRRGKPCAHLVFPKWSVDLAPVFMVTLAYRILLEDTPAPADRRARAAVEVSRVGLEMIAGQELDLKQPVNGDQHHRLIDTYSKKTGALFAAATKVAAILCGADDCEAELLYGCGMNIGLGYQFLDDVADTPSYSPGTGKQQGMDVNKLTSVQLFGSNGAEDRAKIFEVEAQSRLGRFGSEADLLRSLISEARLGVF